MTDYYQAHADEYFQKTVSIDSASFLTDFVRFLPPGAAILDIGCGSGRDLLWLKKQGYCCIGLEQSEGLARLARAHSGCDVIAWDFETFDFSKRQFGALLASGSFVHIPDHRLAQVMSRARQALSPGGVFYVSLKHGVGEQIDATGRRFYLRQDQELRRIFAQINMSVLFFSRDTSALNPADEWLAYVLRVETP
jgi:SAM-dependent methyltransferase